MIFNMSEENTHKKIVASDTEDELEQKMSQELVDNLNKNVR